MVQCAYGSQPKATSPEWFTFETADIATFAPPLAGIISVFAMGIPVTPQNTADFCSIEPVGDLPTDEDYANLHDPITAILSGALVRFGNLLRAYKFAQLCECTGAPSGGSGDPCTTLDGLEVNNDNITIATGPFPGSNGYWNEPGIVSGIYPAGQHHIRLAWYGVPGTNVQYQIYTPGTGYVVASASSGGTNGSIHGEDPAHPTSYQIVGTVSSGNFTPHTARLDFWNASGESSCAGADFPFVEPTTPDPPTDWPGPLDPPTCGSYQDICNAIGDLLAKVTDVQQLVTLIQRQHVPYAYLLGETTTGLTGTGSLSVQGILGVVVSLTTVPASWGGTAETPKRLIPAAGSIQAHSSDGYDDNRQLHYVDQVLMMDAPWATSVRYNLRTGVVATITTLLREP